jgi:hypothetical protein
LVTGIAGLLLSQSDTLRPETLRSLIVDGALAGSRTAGAFPIVNARESLKLLSERSGTPLCGNRIWTAPSSIVIDRGAQTEAISVGGHTWISDLVVRHGGRTIEYEYLDPDSSWKAAALRYNGGGWVTSTPGVDTMTLSGAAQSARVTNHDGTQHAILTWISETVGSQAVERVKLFLRDSASQLIREYTIKDYAEGPPGRQTGCAVTTQSGCVRIYDHPPTAGIRGIVAAYSPVANEIVLAVSRRSAVVGADSVYTFIDDTFVENTVFPERYTWSSAGAEVFRINVDSSSAVAAQVLSLTGSNVYSVAIAEDGREVMLMVGDEQLTERFSGTRGADFGVGTRQQGNCAVTFRLASSPDSLTRAGVTTSTGCPPWDRAGMGAGATFGARRRGIGTNMPITRSR